MHYSLVKANGEEGPKIETFMVLKPTSDEGALREIKSICFSQEKQLMENPSEMNGYSEGPLSEFLNFRVLRNHDPLISKSINNSDSLSLSFKNYFMAV